MDISSMVYKTLPLYESIYTGRPRELESAKLMLPNKVKLLISPTPYQVLVSGMYFIVPFEPDLEELEELEAATLQCIQENGSLASKHPLNVSEKTIVKFKDIVYKVPRQFNSFRYKYNKLYLTGSKCLFVNPFTSNCRTDINCPAYGYSYSVESIAKASMSVLAILSSNCEKLEGTQYDRIIHDLKVIDDLHCDYGPELLDSLFGLVFKFDSLCFFESSDALAIGGLVDLVLSYYDPCTSVPDYMQWK
jgi:hypothetical protein